MASEKLEKILTEIESLTVLEIADLVKSMEDRWGISAAAAPVAMAAVPVAGPVAAEQAAEEEQIEFTVVLTDIGPKKIQVIKAVRELVSGLGLKEAKDLVEAVPKEILENVPKEEAEAARKKLEEAGGAVEIK